MLDCIFALLFQEGNKNYRLDNVIIHFRNILIIPCIKSCVIICAMKTKADKKLFWYLKDDVEIDLDNPSHVDMYVQQVLSYGKLEDIKRMLRMLQPEKFRESFRRIKKFLPKEVRRFWEAGLGDTGEGSKGSTQLP